MHVTRKAGLGLATLTLAGLLTAGGLLVPSRSHGDGDGRSSDSRIARGLAIAPVPLNLKGKNLDMVGIGSYIVNAQADCSGCHTQPEFAAGHDPFQGEPEQVNTTNYLAGGQPFGPFISRNLTPENGLPAGMTFSQFLLVMRTGIDLDNQHPHISPLLQVMPWPAFRKMNDRDLRAVYEYLRAIPPAQPGS